MLYVLFKNIYNNYQNHCTLIHIFNPISPTFIGVNSHYNKTTDEQNNEKNEKIIKNNRTSFEGVSILKRKKHELLVDENKETNMKLKKLSMKSCDEPKHHPHPLQEVKGKT